VLGEDPAAVRDDVEDAVVALLQRRIDADLALDRGRQTGGPGEVVSTHAVRDLDGHRSLLLFRRA